MKRNSIHKIIKIIGIVLIVSQLAAVGPLNLAGRK